MVDVLLREIGEMNEKEALSGVIKADHQKQNQQEEERCHGLSMVVLDEWIRRARAPESG